MAEDATRYDIFVSYSHRADRDFSRKLQQAIERFEKPLFRPRRYRVFRDETDMGIALDLPEELVQRLDESNYLLICASPEAADSPWVEQEVSHWLERPTGLSTIGVVWTRGADGDEAPRLPPSLARVTTEDVLYLDLRKQHETGEISTEDVARIVSHVTRRRFRTVFDREARRQRRVNQAMVLTALVVAGLAVGSLLLWLNATRATDLAAEADLRAEQANVQAEEAEVQAQAASTEAEEANTRAEEAGTRAEESRRRTEALGIAAVANEVVADDPALAVAIAAEAVVASTPAEPDALSALAQARLALGGRSSQRIRSFSLPVGSDVVFSADLLGDRVAYRPDGSDSIVVEDIGSGAQLTELDVSDFTIQPDPTTTLGGFSEYLVFSGDGRLLIYVTTSGVVTWSTGDWVRQQVIGADDRIAFRGQDGEGVAPLGQIVRLDLLFYGLAATEDGSGLSFAFSAAFLDLDEREIWVAPQFEVDSPRGSRATSIAVDVPLVAFIFDSLQGSGGFVSPQRISVWNYERGELVTSIEIEENNLPEVADVAISPSGDVVATVGADVELRLWDLDGNDLGRRSDGYTAAPSSVVFDRADGAGVLVATANEIVRWDLGQETESWRLTGFGDRVEVAALVSGRNRVLVGGAGEYELWQTGAGGSSLEQLVVDQAPGSLSQPIGNLGSIRSEIGLAVGDGLIVVQTAADRLTVLDARSLEPIAEIPIEPSIVLQISIDSSSSVRVATQTGFDQGIRRYDLQSGDEELLALVTVSNAGRLSDLDFLGGDRFLRPDVRLGIQEYGFGQLVDQSVRYVVPDFDDALYIDAEPSADLERIHAVTVEGDLDVVDPDAGEVVARSPGYFGELGGDGLGRLLIDDGSDTLVLVEDAGRAHYGSISDAEATNSFLIPGGNASAAFDGANGILVTTDDQHALLIWHAPTGRLLAELPGHTDRVRTIRYTEDGAGIISASDDGTVRLWQDPLLVAPACIQIADEVDAAQVLRLTGLEELRGCESLR
ncbi:MAG: TIR domain-containing protein [Actinomycetota bacterium]